MVRRFLSPLALALTAFACGKTASAPTLSAEYPTIQLVDCDGSSVEGRPWRQAPREDGLYAHLAERIPGFGGMFPEADRLAVYLTDIGTSERARPTLEWFLRREFPELTDRIHNIHWIQVQAGETGSPDNPAKRRADANHTGGGLSPRASMKGETASTSVLPTRSGSKS